MPKKLKNYVIIGLPQTKAAPGLTALTLANSFFAAFELGCKPAGEDQAEYAANLAAEILHNMHAEVGDRTWKEYIDDLIKPRTADRSHNLTIGHIKATAESIRGYKTPKFVVDRDHGGNPAQPRGAWFCYPMVGQPIKRFTTTPSEAAAKRVAERDTLHTVQSDVPITRVAPADARNVASSSYKPTAGISKTTRERLEAAAILRLKF